MALTRTSDIRSNELSPFVIYYLIPLVSPDGVAPVRMVCVSTSVKLPLHHKVQKFSGTGSPGWSRKKGRKMVVVVVLDTTCSAAVDADAGVCPVYVHNAGHPALYDMATVHVSVRDVNDNAPVFVKTSNAWTLDVPENANMAAVHTVEAYDADVGDNAEISYSITGMI